LKLFILCSEKQKERTKNKLLKNWMWEALKMGGGGGAWGRGGVGKGEEKKRLYIQHKKPIKNV
jgi:hypothetical protein